MDELHFEQLPSLLPCYIRALVSGHSASRLANVAIPDIRATADSLIVDPARLARFRQLLEIDDDGMLPPTFLQALAAPLHLSLLTAKEFPLRVTGLVHLSNSIDCVESIGQNQSIELAAMVSAEPATARGIEITLATTAAVAGRCLWSASSLLLARAGGRRQRQPAGARFTLQEPREMARWRADRNIGRRYAAVSGDYNPIHLHGITARAFGFSAPIAHGMWSLARSLTSLSHLLQPPYRLEAQFRRPMLLPAELGLQLGKYDDKPAFQLSNAATNKIYLTGSIVPGA